MTILITGGAGFIGSNFVLDWLSTTNEKIINLDKLTYAGNANNLNGIKDNLNHIFVQGDIANQKLIAHLLGTYKVRAVLNFAAESHVDRSIKKPEPFIDTNIVGTFKLLEASRIYWSNLSCELKSRFRFIHISTDEVYGSLAPEATPFQETHPYEPNNPYSASKAASDHLVRAYHHTYGLPTITTHCSNNYGPFQFPEKLIPLTIYRALSGEALQIYGDGQQIRDWLFVEDHCDALRCLLEHGQMGEVYNIGGMNEKKNIDLVLLICQILDEIRPKKDGTSYRDQIVFVADRQGHDKRYAINATKLMYNLHWKPKVSFEQGINKTINWYLNHQSWLNNIISGAYHQAELMEEL